MTRLSSFEYAKNIYMTSTAHTKVVMLCCIAALTSACTAQIVAPAPTSVAVNYKAFTEHPTHCSAFLNGQAGSMFDASRKQAPEDSKATDDLKKLLDSAVTEQQRNGIQPSLLNDCTRKLVK